MAFDGRTRVVVMTKPEPGAIDLVTRDLPELQPGEALVKIKFAGVCGTDLHIIGWNAWAARSYQPPFALGHEFCGEIIETKQGAPFKPGDRVTAETHLACGHCDQCRNGRGHTCDNLKTFSRLDRGAFTDYAVVPVALLRKVPDSVSDQVGAIMEPLGIAVRCAREVGSEGKDILVSGCGPIGLMTIAACRHFGAHKVIASDPSPERRQFALKMGADFAINPIEEKVDEFCRQKASGKGVDLTIETSGAPSALTSGLNAIRRGGTLIMAGLPSGDVAIDVSGQIVLREITLKGIYGRLLDQTWHDTERALENGLDIGAVITDIFALEDYKAAIACARDTKAGKVLFRL